MNAARLIQAALAGAAAVCGLIAVGSFLHYWDASFLVWKRWIKADPYVYEEIDPRLRAVDPATLIRVRSPADAAATRAALIGAIWGGPFPLTEPRPSRTEVLLPATEGQRHATCDRRQAVIRLRLECELDRYRGIANLARIERHDVPLPRGYTALFAHFRPKQGNGRVVFYHHGLAGTYHQHWRHLARLIERGFAVIAFNMISYGETPLVLDVFNDVRSHVEPVMAAVNMAVGGLGYDRIDMIGFSAGAWVTVLAAAIDPRIRVSYPIAGTLPEYLRDDREKPPPQMNETLLAAASYLDMYVLGGLGPGRKQLQIFNRYDRAYQNARGRLYEAAVAEAIAAAGGGAFGVVVDETTARHKITGRTMDLILADLDGAAGRRPRSGRP